MRKVHVNLILTENCDSRSLQQLRVPLLLKEYQSVVNVQFDSFDPNTSGRTENCKPILTRK